MSGYAALSGGAAGQPSYHASPAGPPLSSTGGPSTGSSSSSSAPSAFGGISFNSSAFVAPTLAAAAMESERVNKYETRLPIRLDVEAAMAYVFGAVSAF
ncbi:hypothetical protein HK405_005982 [Cladochytrium tenue]|nr:hypothetical protein HK405_005982 [Cladochytrium tenue]